MLSALVYVAWLVMTFGMGTGHLNTALRGGRGNLKPTLQSASARYVSSSVVSSKPRSQCMVESTALRVAVLQSWSNDGPARWREAWRGKGMHACSCWSLRDSAVIGV